MDSGTLLCCLGMITQGTNIKQCLVLAKNQLHLIKKTKVPCAAILNTDPSSKKGRHWCSIFIYKKNGKNVTDFYDSYGHSFEFYGFKIQDPVVFVNSKPHQSMNSAVCGLFALRYLYYRSRNYSNNCILSTYTKNLLLNDEIVKLFYRKIVRVKYRSLIQKKKQSCCSRLANKF